MNQRQLNMIQACQNGIEQARKDLKCNDPLAIVTQAWEEICDDGKTSMTLAKASYLAAMFIAWKDMGSPDVFG